MKVLMTGGTGFIGQYLSQYLSEQGHQIIILSRHPGKHQESDGKEITVKAWADDLSPIVNEVEAIINLAGENLSSQRWTAAVKKRILESRVKTTRAIVDGIEKAENKPRVLLSASAVNYYGDHGRDRIRETVPPANDFLALVCQQWEDEARKTETHEVRTIITRIGLPMQTDGGVLKKMLIPFKLGVGGPLGNGRQFFPWIHMLDLCRAFDFLLTNEKLTGPYNVTAPTPVTMRQFAVELGKVLHRPAWLPVPKMVLDIVLGELAKPILASMRVVPQNLLNAGFKFQFEELGPALKDILN